MENPIIIQKIITWSLQGNSRLDIIELVKTHSPKELTNIEIDQLIQHSKQVLADSVSTDNDQTINIHVGYYERIYKYFHSIDHVDGCNKAMAGKEKLLGMSGGGTKITISRKTEINVNQEVQYDISRLSLYQQERLRQIEMKMQPEIRK